MTNHWLFFCKKTVPDLLGVEGWKFTHMFSTVWSILPKSLIKLTSTGWEIMLPQVSEVCGFHLAMIESQQVIQHSQKLYHFVKEIMSKSYKTLIRMSTENILMFLQPSVCTIHFSTNFFLPFHCFLYSSIGMFYAGCISIRRPQHKCYLLAHMTERFEYWLVYYDI